jgi:hypothetical protein
VPRDFERETSEALSTLRTLLPTDVAAVAGTSTAPDGSYLLGESLEFQATLVADLVYARKFDDKATWDRCVGVYMSIWTNVEIGSAFSEAVRSHYHAIDQVRCKVYVFFLLVLTDLIRPSTIFWEIRRTVTKFCVIRCFPWHTEPFFSFHIQHSALSVVVDTASSGLMGLGNQRSCANYETAK